MSTKRIALNMAATYAQTFVSVVVGLFCSRWVYIALGETQFGLFAVVGSLIAFISVLNITLVESSGRFFSFAIGQQSRPGAEKDLVCKWFNTALSVQVLLPTAMVLVGAPAGIYAIMHVLNIPDGLRLSSVYIFGFSLLAMFAQMMFSPVQALYYAKQFIFVRNLFGIVNAVLFAAEGWWLLHYDGNRLVAHAAATTALMLTTNALLAAFAGWQFPEARVHLKYWFDKKRIREMFSFSSFLLIGTLGGLFSNAGVALVLNKFFGPAANAALGIGTQVYTKSAVVAQAMNEAAAPELTARVGADRFDHARRLGVRICVYSTSMALLIAAPFIAFSESILTLWLKEPPQYATQIAVIMMMNLLAERITAGYMMLVHASGRIQLYTTCLGIGNGLRCLLVFLLLLGGLPLIPTLWLGWFLPFVILNQMRVWFAKRAIGISVRQYFRTVFIPLAFIGSGSFAFSFGFKALAGDAVWAILAGTAANAGVVAALMWMLIGSDERRVLRAKFASAWATMTLGHGPATSPIDRCGCPPPGDEVQ
jgi:O-antigen/teichoic acid export membrane protein